MSAKSPTRLEDLIVSRLLHIAYSVGWGWRCSLSKQLGPLLNVLYKNTVKVLQILHMIKSFDSMTKKCLCDCGGQT